MDMPNMGLTSALQRDLRRALRDHQYDRCEDGRLYVPKAKVFIGGVFDVEVNGRERELAPNLLATAGMIDILFVYFNQGSQRTAFYLAPFSGNVDPAATLTAANFAATQTEFVNYAEGARPAWTPPAGAPATPSIDNTASPGVITCNADTQTVWGMALIGSASAKQATTGVLTACTKFASAKALNNTDTLSSKYTFSATDAS